MALHPEDLYGMEGVRKLLRELEPPKKNILMIQSRPGEHALAEILTETLTSHIYHLFTKKGEEAPSVELQRIEADNLPFVAVANANYENNHIVGLANLLKEEGGINQDYNIVIHSDKGITLRMGRRPSQRMAEDTIRIRMVHNERGSSLHVLKGYTRIKPEEIELEVKKLRELEERFEEIFNRLGIPIKHVLLETVLDPTKPEYYDVMVHLEGGRLPEELVYVLNELKNIVREHLRYGDIEGASRKIRDLFKEDVIRYSHGR